MNLLGEYIEEISRRQGVPWEQYAKEAKIDASTISRIAARGGNKPQPQTIKKLVQAMQNHEPWLDSWKQGLYNLAKIATEEQEAEAYQQLVYFREHPDYPNQEEHRN